MNELVKDTANQILESAPCSMEMPAGTGKTELLAAAAAVAALDGRRSLILTHTNAGVDAVRKRLRLFGVDSKAAYVDTITSWAFSLVGAYSDIAETVVPENPDWSDSDSYVTGATKVARSSAAIKMHTESFDYLLVDEYQDCTLLQHEFVLALAAAVPKTVIFGDRLQAIFGFAGALAEWDTHVLPDFPAYTVAYEAHRWAGHNPELGRWLLELRPSMVSGTRFDFAEHTIPGLNWVQGSGPSTLATIAHAFRDFDETVVLLDKWPADVASHASRLGGSYSVMEDIQGNFMRRQIASLPPSGDPHLALWFAKFAKECVVGLAAIDQPILNRLSRNEQISHYTRPSIQTVVTTLEALRTDPTYEQLHIAAQVIRSAASTKVYRWEAWNDTLEAIAMNIENGEPVLANFSKVRERLRRSGRRKHSRIASRTLLVKGLEYDHVIIADLSKIRDPKNLYVALTRARKSVTIIGQSSSVILQDD